MNTLNFRVAIESESGSIASLVNAAYRPKPHMAGWTHESDLVSGNRTSGQQVEGMMARMNSIFLIGLQDSKIVSSVHIEQKLEICHIGMLAVNPMLQTTGLGKATLAFAETYASEHFNVKKFCLSVVSARVELVSFYLRRGYQKTEIFLKYPEGFGSGEPKFSNLMVEILEKSNHAQSSEKTGLGALPS